MQPKTLLSLFDFSGNWSLFYEENGWNVIRIDGKLETDGISTFCVDLTYINTDWMYENIFDVYEQVDGVIAAPPCTDFAVSGAKHWKHKDKPELTLFGEYNRLD
ncbi:MAG: DNA cytosine methyltransferase, partial [Leptospira sp.]|nr:DNA cytosine methyltransferase [Leptospira sp.]